MIPYLSLTLHAIQRVHSDTGLYMQISLTPDISHTSNSDEHDDDELLELTLIPRASGNGDGDISQKDIADTIFKELSVCTSLHSAASTSDDGDDEDRIIFEGEGDGDEPRLEGFPGEGGWITAENVDQFRFEDADELTTILGPGAGSIRRREEGEDVDDAVTDDAKAVDEAKWRRTE